MGFRQDQVDTLGKRTDDWLQCSVILGLASPAVGGYICYTAWSFELRDVTQTSPKITGQCLYRCGQPVWVEGTCGQPAWVAASNVDCSSSVPVYGGSPVVKWYAQILQLLAATAWEQSTPPWSSGTHPFSWTLPFTDWYVSNWSCPVSSCWGKCWALT